MKRYKTYTPRSIRRLEKKSKRKLVWTLFFSITLLSFTLLWALPNLIGTLSTFNKLKPVSKNEVIEGALASPPVLDIPYEATNTASIKIKGFSTPNLEVKIYLDDQLIDTPKSNDEGFFQTKDIDLNLGSNNIYGKTVDPEGKESLPSKTITVIYNSEKPKLDVLEPSDGQEIQGGDKKIKVSGITDVENKVTINNLTVIVGQDGRFSIDIPLNEGENNITVEATNEVGNTTQIQRKVLYKS